MYKKKLKSGRQYPPSIRLLLKGNHENGINSYQISGAADS